MELPLAKTGPFSQHNLSIFYADKLCHETPVRGDEGKEKEKKTMKGREKPYYVQRRQWGLVFEDTEHGVLFIAGAEWAFGYDC